MSIKQADANRRLSERGKLDRQHMTGVELCNTQFAHRPDLVKPAPHVVDKAMPQEDQDGYLDGFDCVHPRSGPIRRLAHRVTLVPLAWSLRFPSFYNLPGIRSSLRSKTRKSRRVRPNTERLEFRHKSRWLQPNQLGGAFPTKSIPNTVALMSGNFGQFWGCVEISRACFNRLVALTCGQNWGGVGRSGCNVGQTRGISANFAAVSAEDNDEFRNNCQHARCTTRILTIAPRSKSVLSVRVDRNPMRHRSCAAECVRAGVAEIDADMKIKVMSKTCFLGSAGRAAMTCES